MEARHPERQGDNEVREEGLAGHWAAYEIGNGRPIPVGTIAPNGVELTDDILDGVLLYLQFLFGFGLPVYMEAPVAIPRIHAECEGTVDAWIWDSVRRLLRVPDLKLGYRPIDPFECWQLLAYLAGIIDQLKLTEHFDFELIIVQPRAYGHPPIKTWRGNSEMLAPYFKKLQDKAHQAAHIYTHGTGGTVPLVGDYGPAFVAGPHCDGCSARGSCEALHSASMAIVDMGSDRALEESADVRHAGYRLRRLMRARETLEAEIGGLEARLEHEIRANGALIPLFEISGGAGKLTWKEGIETQVLATGQMLGVTLAKPVKPLTPLQAIAAMKNVAPGVIEQFAERRPGKMKLRLLAENHAQKLFGDK